MNAYVAVIYMRSKLKDGSYCINFIASKTKINPIERKNLTILKLELMINDMCVFFDQL